MPMKTFTTAMLLSLALPLCGELALAQQTQAHIAVSGGVATDQRGVQSSAIAIAPTLTLQPSPNVALQFGGNATRFATQLWSVGGSATLFAREPLGRFAAVTLTASGSASRLAADASGTFALGDIIPAVEAGVGPLTVYGGARAAAGRATQPGIASGPSPIIGGPPTVPGTVTTASRIGPVYGAVLRFAGDAGALQLSARSEPADGTALSASASLPIARNISLDIGAGSYPVNRLLNTPAGSYATAGLSLRIGGARRGPSLPAPAGVRSPRPGMTRLALRAPNARVVELAGDFTEWKFVAATRAANGVWYADLQIPPGQYRYAFRINGTEWRVPDGATAVDDGFGGKSAWITVPGRNVGR
jgi:hypothetical protein